MNVKREIESRLREWSIINKTEIKWKLLRSQSNEMQTNYNPKRPPTLYYVAHNVVVHQ